ncbi:potassium voltage-gated channel subfamily G member 3-like [Periophthalmus magnuspinnatus]|uniref:potassium voltage-gated channel subfamily G member 3-like n=1 Tax=Periophthalmus magnuspinnatus TaxID=409849 RepID=UPI00145B76B7|nr:potassium voltage-gated channel subfamily G member 3-like [Periophthalmus magnuspinnatus]
MKLLSGCTLNVGGRRFPFTSDLVTHLPLSRLSRLNRCVSESELLEFCDDYDRETNELFFDRHSDAFSFIVAYAQHGALRLAPSMCELSFLNELLYWGLDSAELQTCCQRRLDQRMSDCYVHFFPECRFSDYGLFYQSDRHIGEGCGSRWRGWMEAVRRTFEEPTSSLAAQILASLSVLFVLISMVMLCASTLPDWSRDETMETHRLVESICIGWFTAECTLRFLVSQDKCEFVRRPLNVIDILAIAPYYVSVLVSFLTGEDSELQRAGVMLRVLRMMRIFWLIKLARHFLGLQTLGLTLRRCYREMLTLLVFVGVAMAIFSAWAQLLEYGLDLRARNQDYASIPAACWWVIISMTTVGYGDMYPVTVAGRVLGGVCVVSGIVLLALPITFIYHSFVQCYHELKVQSSK